MAREQLEIRDPVDHWVTLGTPDQQDSRESQEQQDPREVKVHREPLERQVRMDPKELLEILVLQEL